MQIFDVASRHMEWLALRQQVTASNIANANTPGYRSRDIQSFDAVMAQTTAGLARTSPSHLAIEAVGTDGAQAIRDGGWDKSYSSNDVTLEAELVKAGETSRMMSLDAGLTRTFHRMILSSLKI